jgi:Na+/alanine symporter
MIWCTSELIVLNRDRKEYLLFPAVIIFAFGTLIGQMYYKNKISPLVTEKYSNFMQRNWFTRFVMWCGANSLKCFIAQAVVLPLFFGIITLIIHLL